MQLTVSSGLSQNGRGVVAALPSTLYGFAARIDSYESNAQSSNPSLRKQLAFINGQRSCMLQASHHELHGTSLGLSDWRTYIRLRFNEEVQVVHTGNPQLGLSVHKHQEGQHVLVVREACERLPTRCEQHTSRLNTNSAPHVRTSTAWYSLAAVRSSLLMPGGQYTFDDCGFSHWLRYKCAWKQNQCSPVESQRHSHPSGSESATPDHTRTTHHTKMSRADTDLRHGTYHGPQFHSRRRLCCLLWCLHHHRADSPAADCHHRRRRL